MKYRDNHYVPAYLDREKRHETPMYERMAEAVGAILMVVIFFAAMILLPFFGW